jgi:hypothetical protein
MPRDDCLRTRDVLVRGRCSYGCVKQPNSAALFQNYACGGRDVHKAVPVVARRIMLREIRRRPRHWKLTGDVLCIF